MPHTRDAIYVGIAGAVLALDRNDGAEIWRVGLKGSDFVGVVLDGDKILAATRGESFCLDAATGRILWHNELRGLGFGLLTLVTANSPSGSLVNLAEKKRQEDATAGATAVL